MDLSFSWSSGPGDSPLMFLEGDKDAVGHAGPSSDPPRKKSLGILLHATHLSRFEHTGHTGLEKPAAGLQEEG